MLERANNKKISTKLIDDCFYYLCKSSLVPWLEGLCISNPCRFEFSVFLSFCRKDRDNRDHTLDGSHGFVLFRV